MIRPKMRRVLRRGRALLGETWRRADPIVDLVDPKRKRLYPKSDDIMQRWSFPDTERVFELFLKQTRSIADGADGPPVGVVVMPWFGTPVPWYSVALGLGLARRGKSVTFVWHDADAPWGASATSPNDELARVFEHLDGRFPVVRLSEPTSAPSQADDDALLDRLADANLTWLLRGADPTEDDVRWRGRIRQELATDLLRVRALFAAHEFRYALVPGGLTGASGLYVHEGHARGLRVATFDAGLGASAIDVNGVAAHHTDTTRAFAMLSDDLQGRHDDVIAQAKRAYERRRAGVDPDAYQLAQSKQATAPVQQSILIPLNVVFDAAALGLHHIFADSKEWLTETIGALVELTDDPIVVRQHPSERRLSERSRFDAKAVVMRSFGGNEQVRFVAAEDDVNTYDLLDAARLVLPFVSTIGMEAAALGKPVVVSGSAYYADLGFVYAPRTRDDYFDLVKRGARDELPLLPEQTDRAWLAVYLNSCHRVWTNFTPQPPDFWRWVGRQSDDLYTDSGVVDLLTCIDEGIPLSIVQHRRQTQTGRPNTQPTQ